MASEANFEPITEQRNERSDGLDSLPVADIVRLMNEEDATVPAAVRSALPHIAAAIESIVLRMQAGGKLFYVGAGTSGRLGILDASECPPTFGVDPSLVTGIIAGGEAAIRRAIENAEDNCEAGALDVAAAVTAQDAVVGIAASGSTPYVIGAVREAKRIGALTVGISCNSRTALSREVDMPIEVPVGPELITGSTRLKAGTAQKLVLNMISTAAMIKLGKVYGNLMVNVQATNSKLRERVVRIIRQATGADDATARRVCQEADGDARAAILMLRFGIPLSEAAAALAASGHHFGAAVSLLESKRRA
ncbi:N-acetylmuramic acid-6-phosphate etherase [Gordoniibacillus kamchatkensis]|uniref:N-acetylmuramic acid 6-phosphate etherase n=1 Tax=Gordoniibacillus kamchatkensis TaxID=1590651 RepID=A0ABR5ANA3_9BACL|nr:N-acetylmuramic acid 6-phosphate etherase [Paenibacillus sp. VKM B-2647]KIL42508.1 N-acetylmuramic acid-6-phosphate etherase [Paenibacillus sp. VKM B-2647]